MTLWWPEQPAPRESDDVRSLSPPIFGTTFFLTGSENDFQNQLVSIGGRLIGVNGFLCECLLSSPAALAPGHRRQKSGRPERATAKRATVDFVYAAGLSSLRRSRDPCGLMTAA